MGSKRAEGRASTSDSASRQGRGRGFRAPTHEAHLGSEPKATTRPRSRRQNPPTFHQFIHDCSSFRIDVPQRTRRGRRDVLATLPSVVVATLLAAAAIHTGLSAKQRADQIRAYTENIWVVASSLAYRGGDREQDIAAFALAVLSRQRRSSQGGSRNAGIL